MGIRDACVCFAPSMIPGRSSIEILAFADIHKNKHDRILAMLRMTGRLTKKLQCTAPLCIMTLPAASTCYPDLDCFAGASESKNGNN
jgi:hypothetical protein